MKSECTFVTQWPSLSAQAVLTSTSPSRVVIVGGGMAGLEVAVRLSQEGVDDIVVLEAGPTGDPRHNNVAGTADVALHTWLAPETDPYFTRPWQSVHPPHYTGPSGLRRRLGGRSLYWYGVCLPVDDWALADVTAWPREIVMDLVDAWYGGPNLYDITRAMLMHWKKGRLSANETAPTTSIAGLTLLPTPVATRHECADPARWYAYSPLDAWRSPATGEMTSLPDRVRLVTGAQVEQILIEDGVVGLSISTGTGLPTISVPATTVVLAAGTLENTRLAIQALTAAGAIDAPWLQGISDHIVQGFFLRVPQAKSAALTEILPRGAHYASCAPSVRSNLFIDVSRQSDNAVMVDVRVTGEQLPDDQNWARCEFDEALPWKLRVHAAPSQADWTLIQAQRVVLQRVWETIAAAMGCELSTLNFGDFENPARTNAFVLPETIEQAEFEVPLTWSSYLGVEDHEGGTLPLGRVLTSDHEFAALGGLFAAGPSTFPRMGAANPTLTTLALARRLARVVADRIARGNARECI